MSRVLIVGSGFVGQRIAQTLWQAGDEPVLASRSPASGQVHWVRLDVTDPVACADVMHVVKPDAIIAVHGPSDVTWCQREPDAALRAHRDAALNLIAAAGGTRLVMISTDNVFDGRAETSDERTAVAPANAYGHAKLAAEAALADRPNATVLRVSLVYGPENPKPRKRLNFAAHCVAGLRAGRIVPAPADQWTTPVHVDDVARVTIAALDGAPRLLHLGGPNRISRVEWAARIADLLGAPRSLIEAVSKDTGPYACRPTNSCLGSVLLPDLLARWALRVRGVEQGTADTIGEWQ